MKRLFKTLRKPLSDLETKVLLAALDLQSRDPKEGETTYVVIDAYMRWPKCLHRQLYYWREFGFRPGAGRGSTSRGLCSVFSDTVANAAGRYGTMPSQALLQIVSKMLSFCDTMAAFFDKSPKRDWPDLPSPVFRIESSDKLVASYKGDSEQDVLRWWHDCKRVFNSKEFVDCLVAFDAENGFRSLTDKEIEDVDEWEWEQVRQYLYSYDEPLSFEMTCPLRSKGLSDRSIADIAGAHVSPAEGIWEPYGRAARAITSLEERGYVIVCHKEMPSEIRSPAESDIFLTREGFVRATDIYFARHDSEQT